MELSYKELAVQALRIGKQHVAGTRDVTAYIVGECDCDDGDPSGGRIWYAYDAGQIIGVAQGFVAHVMRRHGGELTPRADESEQQKITERFLAFVSEWAGDFNRFRKLGHGTTHKENLMVAATRFSELMESAAQNEANG
ncbi:MAG: hypothetical protein IPM54_03395 [Polyangiaceae bacterium]|nr:hypothetical protein [Polyangiaceae bacterium]